MNEEIKAIVKGSILKKSFVLDNPDQFRDSPMICLKVDEEYMAALTRFAHEDKVDLSMIEIHLFPESQDITERARKFFFQMRDSLAVKLEDDSRDHKDTLYRNCIRSLGFRDKGRLKNSIRQLDRRELWLATETMYNWLIEADYTMQGETREKDIIMEGLSRAEN